MGKEVTSSHLATGKSLSLLHRGWGRGASKGGIRELLTVPKPSHSPKWNPQAVNASSQVPRTWPCPQRLGLLR